MTDTILAPIARRKMHLTPIVGIFAGLLSLSFLLGICVVRTHLPGVHWTGMFNPAGIDDITLRYSALPRMAVALLAGSALAMSGVLFQQVLRNPLAEPTTLGASAGAQLFLTIATLFAPGLLQSGQEWVALAGASVATALVFAMAAGNSWSPLSLIVAGLVVSLLCGSLTGLLSLFHWQYLNSIFVWASGSLVQNDWSTVEYLIPRLAGAAIIAALLARPLSIMALDDESARGLGLPLNTIRLFALGMAVSLAAFVVSAVGVIAFIGLAAPTLARLSGARRFKDRLIWSPLLGASLLLLADQSVQLLSAVMPEVPTGVATVLLGGPLLLWLLPKLGNGNVAARLRDDTKIRPARHPFFLFVVATALLLAMLSIGLVLGQGVSGWSFNSWGDLQSLLQWRWPRVVAALAAGTMLAIAGAIMQRMTGNPMAAPEVLGISSGASLGVIVSVFVVPAAGKATQLGAATGGALLTLIALILLGRRNSFSPERMLLAGVAIGTIFSAVVSFLMVSGDPRMGMLLTWMAGSTYRITASDAFVAITIAVSGVLIVLLMSRWLAILPLGDAASVAVGINLGKSRFALLLMSAILTASATLIVGPLSFVGLMAPHMARMAGLQRPLDHLFASAALGALIMVAADWLGRNLIFPYQIPAGLFATLIGGPYFLWLMRRLAA